MKSQTQRGSLIQQFFIKTPHFKRHEHLKSLILGCLPSMFPITNRRDCMSTSKEHFQLRYFCWRLPISLSLLNCLAKLGGSSNSPLQSVCQVQRAGDTGMGRAAGTQRRTAKKTRYEGFSILQEMFSDLPMPNEICHPAFKFHKCYWNPFPPG